MNSRQPFVALPLSRLDIIGDDNRCGAGRREGAIGGDESRLEAPDWTGLLDVERFASRNRRIFVDETNLTAASALGELVRHSRADRTRTQDRDDCHRWLF